MYKIKNTTEEYLIDNGFREIGDGVFKLRFPISFYKRIPTVFCVATVVPSWGKRVNIDIEDMNGKYFAMWYDTKCDQLHPRFRKELDKNISRRMHKIGARHYADR